MAVRIRLQRKGARHMAFYRIVAADSRSPRDGRFIDQLGYYDPLKEPADIKVDTEKVIDWFQKGALPTETVKSLFSRVGIMETWHEVRKGKSLDELRYIEDEARKRIEAQAAMNKRKRDEAKAAKKDEAEKKADEEPAAEAEEKGAEEPPTESEPTPDDAKAEATGAEEADAEPAAEEPAVEARDEAETAGEAGAEEPEKEEKPSEEQEAASEPEQEQQKTEDKGSEEGDDSESKG